MKKIISIILLIICITSLFTSCSKIKNERIYRSDASADDVAHLILPILPSDSMTRYTKDDIRLIHGDSLAKYDCCIYASSSANSIDEFGVFHDENGGKEIQKLLEEYISSSAEGKDSYLRSYNPKEADKLKNASVKVFGDYIVYTFLSEDVKEEIYEKLEDELKTKE